MKEPDCVQRARQIIRAGTIEPAEAPTIREAAVELRQNGALLTHESRRIIDAAINIYGQHFDAPAPWPSPFDQKIAELEDELRRLADAHQEASERAEATAREIGGPLVLDGGNVMLKLPPVKRDAPLTAEETRRLFGNAQACAAEERRTREVLESRGAELRNKIRLLRRAANDWRREQAEKNGR